VEINLVIVSLCEILVNALTDTNIIALDRAKYALVLSQRFAWILRMQDTIVNLELCVANVVLLIIVLAKKWKSTAQKFVVNVENFIDSRFLFRHRYLLFRWWYWFYLIVTCCCCTIFVKLHVLCNVLFNIYFVLYKVI